MKNRWSFVAGSREVELAVPLLIDGLRLPTYLQPGVDITINLYPGDPKFHLISLSDNPNYNVNKKHMNPM